MADDDLGAHLHIGIDAHSVGTGLAGNESYITNLIEALAEIDQRNRYTLYVTKRVAVERFHNRWPNFTTRLTLPHTPIVRIPVTLTAELRRNPVDLLHVQFTAPPLAPCPVVATIHDLSFEHLPETFKRRSRFQLRLTVRRTARKAAHILTISDYSRQDILNTYKLDPERVTITPLAAPKHFGPVTDEGELRRVRKDYGIAGDYILAVGSIQPRKNLSRLMAAYAQVLRSAGGTPMPKLVLVGKRAWLYGETLESVDRLGLSGHVIFTGYVPEGDLPALYSGALFFVYPSFYEGFGLPPLESMQCGTPVITGDRTSLPEVVGDAGLLVDPYDISAISGAITRLLKDPDLRTSLSAKGLQQAKRFNWTTTAAMTLGIFERVASRAGKHL